MSMSDAMIIIAPILVGLSFALLLFGVWRMVNNLEKSEIDAYRDKPPGALAAFSPIIKLIKNLIKNRMGEKYRKGMQYRLSAAGLTYSLLPEEFLALKFVGLAIGGILFFALHLYFPGLDKEYRLLSFALFPIGYFYFDLWLNDKVKVRRALIEKQFPFLLDLLVLSMRAGLNYSSSLANVVGIMPNGPVRDEFARLLREIRAGKSRKESLLGMADRMNVAAIHNFVAAINQADETGGQISDVLAAQANQRRAERFNRAEEKANQAPVKLLFPLVTFLFPVMFMLIIFILLVKVHENGMLPPFMAQWL